MYEWVILAIGLTAGVLAQEVHVTNLNDACVRCLCHVTGCDTSHDCSDGYCGPFYISRLYWLDAGKPTLPDDDPRRKEGCDTSHDCSDGYCGPFYISRLYWLDAGKPTLPDDDPHRTEAFEDCARDFHCSIRIVKSYMAKYGKDCNGDGVTDCFDYMMINYHGGRACAGPLHLTSHGRRWLATFQQCRL